MKSEPSTYMRDPTLSSRRARNGCSRLLDSAPAPEIAARARSASLGRSKWPVEPLGFAGALKSWSRLARLHWRVRIGRSFQLGRAGALEIAVRDCSSSLGKAELLLGLARSASLGWPTALLKVIRMRRYAKKRLGNAGFNSRPDLNTWLVDGLL